MARWTSSPPPVSERSYSGESPAHSRPAADSPPAYRGEPMFTRLMPLCVLLVVSMSFAQDHKSWKDYGGGPDTSRYTALSQITKANVKKLEPAWTYFNGSAGMNPVIVDDV